MVVFEDPILRISEDTIRVLISQKGHIFLKAFDSI